MEHESKEENSGEKLKKPTATIQAIAADNSMLQATKFTRRSTR